MGFTFKDAQAKLAEAGQSHVLRFKEVLTAGQLKKLCRQIETLDCAVLKQMQSALQAPPASFLPGLPEPAPVINLTPEQRAAALPAGEELLRSGKTGVVLVAGGQGSRLGFDGPKGIFQVAPLSNASLFEIHSRKILALENKYGAGIPFYIMTSEANNAATRAFFEKHRYFGRRKELTFFFPQGMWPALTGEGRLILDEPGHIFSSPDGHGGLLAALQKHGMFDDMQQRGITTLFYFQVDNPLVDVADPVFLGVHSGAQSEMSIKVCAKRDAAEGLGVVVFSEGRRIMLEYSELTDEQKNACRADGDLFYKHGSVAIHVFDREFLQRCAREDMPLHIARKKVPYCDDTGIFVTPDKPNACKFEKFIFDVLPLAERSINVEFRRDDEFSPLKNASGPDSSETCRSDMVGKYSRWLEECGVKVPRRPDGTPEYAIEIDPCYANSPSDLSASLPQGFEIKSDTLLR